MTKTIKISKEIIVPIKAYCRRLFFLTNSRIPVNKPKMEKRIGTTNRIGVDPVGKTLRITIPINNVSKANKEIGNETINEDFRLIPNAFLRHIFKRSFE